MNKVIIFSDSTCDLTNELISKNNIQIIPFNVILDNVEYEDGIDINSYDLMLLCSEKNLFPVTAARSPEYYYQRFKEYVDKGYDILFAGIGGNLSAAYKFAKESAERFPEGRVLVLDSMNLSSSTGQIILKACMLRDKGYSVKEIYEELNKRIKNFFSNFTVFSLDFLKKGGRVSSFKAFIGTILRAKPILGVRNGLLTARATVKGDFKKGLDFMLDELEFHYKKNNLVLDIATVTHVYADDAAKYLKDGIKQRNIPFENVYETYAGCTIASHCGMKTSGVLYEVKDSSIDYLDKKQR